MIFHSDLSISTYWVLGLAVCLASCVTPEAASKRETPRPMENLVQVQPAELPKGLKTREKDTLPFDLTLIQPELNPKIPRERGPRFTLAARDVDVKTILFALSKKIDQNIIIDPDISGKVTVNLKEVTLKEALRSLLSPLRLVFDIEKDFIRVEPAKMETRIFHLNYIISHRTGGGNLRASRSLDSFRAANWTQNESANLGGSLEASLAETPSSSWVHSSEETDIWKEILSGLRQIVSGGTGESVRSGKVSNSHSFPSGRHATSEDLPTRPDFSVNRQSGIIVVTDYPDVLLRVAEFLEAVEGSVQRQVFIQSRIIEVSLTEHYRTGIDWDEVAPLNLASPGKVPSGKKGLMYGVGDAHLDAIVDALSRQGEVRVLSSPKIATLNNQRAVIKVGTEDILFVPERSGTSKASRKPRGYVPSPFIMGIVLDVVPQINANGMVMMSIHTSISEKTGERVSPDGWNTVPILDVRESNSVVLAENGQTVVIGGLMKSKKGPREDPGSWLEDIPIFGGWFQQDETTSKKSELVILLTPEIMAGGAVEDRLRIETDRLTRFGEPGSVVNPGLSFNQN